MWVYRGVLYVKPGLMAEAIAHGKTRTPPEGVGVRVLRPINGEEANTQLIFEFSFEDPDAYFAGTSSPQPANAWVKRWIELGQSRGAWDLYKVVHTVSNDGPPGPWVYRQVFHCLRGRRDEFNALWRAVPLPPFRGFDWRILRPRTCDELSHPIIIETTAASLPALDETISGYLRTPEGSEWVKKVFACVEGDFLSHLLRVVE